ncbi:hypothetical protein Trydic_g20296, partial [Trypoxylus dichotomus]
MVIKESMRYYTPVPFISRLVDKDVNLDGIFIPKGLSIILFLYGIHMNPKYYPNPEKFDPSRFERDAESHHFLAFGTGPRQCIGQRFAMWEMKYLLCQILRKFNILEVPGHVPKLSLCVLLKFQNDVMIRQYGLNKKLIGFVSPPGLPILKHFWLFASEFAILQNLINLSRKYGERIKLELFYGVPILLTSDRDIASHILNTVLLKDAFYELAETWVGQGLITCKPDKWKKSRKMLNPAFNIQILEGYLKSFENSSNALIKRLKVEVGNDGFDVLPYMNLCTLDIICETIMGIKLNVQGNKNMQYTTDIHEMSAIVIRRLFSPFKRHPWLYRLTKDYKSETKIIGRIRGLTQRVIDDRKRIKANMEINNTNGELANNTIEKSKRKSLLDILLEAEIDGRPLTNTELIDETQSFLFAGHDTSAMCISLCLYCLSKHQYVQANVVKELELIFDEDARSPTI